MRHPKLSNWKNRNSTGLVAILVALSIATGMMTLYAGHESVESEAAHKHAVDLANSLSKSFRTAAGDVLPSVVMITNEPASPTISRQAVPSLPQTPSGDLFRNPGGKRFFREFPAPPSGRRSGIGSGVIIDDSGIILTNNHVVAGGGKITVRLHDNREFKAIDVKTDPKTDLAIVRIKAKNLKAARLGNSDQTSIGDWVIALGQPFGLEGSVTAGIISAKRRGIGITARENFLQTDAAINPGNSGGPLVNLKSEVIGINTAISSSSGGNQGIGFAIPVNLAKWVSRQLVNNGTVHRGQLGVAVQTLTHPLAQNLGLKTRLGVLVSGVQSGSPAEAAGLKRADVIVEFAGKKISNPRELQNAVETSDLNGKHHLTVIRNGKTIEIEVTIRKQTAGTGASSRKPSAGKLAGLGFTVETLTADISERLGMRRTSGVVITSVQPGSPSANAGLQPGMAVIEVNRKKVESVPEFNNAMQKSRQGEGLLLLVKSRQGTRYLVILLTESNQP